MNTKQQNTKRALTIVETAEYACVSRGIIESWLLQGFLPYEELPGTGEGKGIQRFRRIRRVDIEDFLDKHYRPGRQENPYNNGKKTKKPLILLSKPSLEKRHGSP